MKFPLLDEVIDAETTDIYFSRTEQVLSYLELNPEVGIKLFCRQNGYICGIEQVIQLLKDVGFKGKVLSKKEGDTISKGETAMEIYCRYHSFGLWETAILGILSSCTGWTTAAKELSLIASYTRADLICFGARHIHPNVASIMDYCAVVGGCKSCSTPLGAALANVHASGTMPHALTLIVGDTLRAATAFDEVVSPEVPRIVLVDTFQDEIVESLRIAEAMKEKLDGVRLDTPSERGGVTIPMTFELRERLDLANFEHVKITVSGGFTQERVRQFIAAHAPVDGYGVGSAIAAASPIDFTADIREIAGKPVAKRGRIPGLIVNPSLTQIYEM